MRQLWLAYDNLGRLGEGCGSGRFTEYYEYVNKTAIEFSSVDYEDACYLPFENMQLPAPVGYRHILTILYGDYMSDNLRQLGMKLVYIPGFKTDEFDDQDEVSMINMKYYVYMPGLINANLILVQSDNIRNRYLEKLSQVYPEGDIWDKKILSYDNTILSIH